MEYFLTDFEIRLWNLDSLFWDPSIKFFYKQEAILSHDMLNPSMLTRKLKWSLDIVVFQRLSVKPVLAIKKHTRCSFHRLNLDVDLVVQTLHPSFGQCLPFLTLLHHVPLNHLDTIHLHLRHFLSIHPSFLP